ncbi:hypothetical protein J5N97_027919 [Dioscorea zingiberensis]|uniref:Wee1-like protein kinase n=1 Tax=Dioscorea zingiberensis TaxID=325984 RepID=A0A9D5BXK4_9LILI|nr:hypothetical protein J5N97_027919 [Dioscorea zingiberensis]
MAAEGSSSARNLGLQLKQVTLLPFEPPSRSQKPIEAPELPLNLDVEEGDCILSQDFFCTPDYITPDGQQIWNDFELNKEYLACPKSPEKSIRTKRHRKENSPCNPLGPGLLCPQQTMEVQNGLPDSEAKGEGDSSRFEKQKKPNYVSQSAVALRCRVMPPPCVKNPYLNATSSNDLDLFGDRRSKVAGFSPTIGGDGLSRYRTDFHEIEQIGLGNFSRVFKVLKRIDGCLYAVKRNIQPFHNDMERMRALMEVQALAALGSHENIVGYYTSWFENDQLYIQMELCDQSLTINGGYTPRGGDVLEALYQIAKALQFMHEHGIAHMDVKPENIYIKNGIYKLGDFGCATLTDRTLRIEEGDSRYMPLEMLNDKYEHLDKVDIFSLGATIYELVKGSPLPDSGPQFSHLREGKISLLPGYSMQFQSLLKAMMDPDPKKRPAAKEIIGHSIFEKTCRNTTHTLHSSRVLQVNRDDVQI